MPSSKSMQQLLPLVREYGCLDRKRQEEGVTALEYQRWLDLNRQLAEVFAKSTGHVPPPGQVERRAHPRLPTRLLIHYRSLGELRKAIIRSVSRGGLFIETAFAPAVGTALVVRLTVGDAGEVVEVPCEVVSNNISGDFSTRVLGMGVKFKSLSPSQHAAIDALFASALEEAA